MEAKPPMLISQRIVQLLLIIVSLIALSGGSLQFYLGEPDTTPRLDNIHRFMAGVYFSCGLIAGWAALTIRKQSTLIYLIAFAVFAGGLGRLYSMTKVGLPEPAAQWLGYLIPELIIPVVIIAAHVWTAKRQKQ